MSGNELLAVILSGVSWLDYQGFEAGNPAGSPTLAQTP